LQQAGETLRKKLGSAALLITRGSRGMALFEEAGHGPLLIPVYGTDQVADVTGAGDTVIAAFTLALAAGASFRRGGDDRQLCGWHRRHEDGNGDRIERRAAPGD